MLLLDAAPTVHEAVAAIRAALTGGLDPDQDPPRAVVPVPAGQFLLMPASWDRYAGVKVASVAPGNPARGLPRIQGHYLLMDGPTLTPMALLDGVALTSVRTAAVSAVAADLLAVPDAERLVVFGTGPQAQSHLEAFLAVRPVQEVVVVGRNPARTEAFVARYPFARTGTPDDVSSADLIVCCTSSRTPVFEGAKVPEHATVVAVGSHEPDAREVDDVLIGRSTVVVEAIGAATREAGEVVLAMESGALAAGDLVSLAALAQGFAVPPGPRLFKSVGMAWEDLVVAAAAYEAAA
ncbi:ornithine cyclodeaminase [Amycolatopsis sp. AA4]|uniref:ornithine cyclodeaminase family protein n=1 Tax=Actinomycetes TaxID=1760 RepID=UPI0001B585A5|nr:MULTISPECIES: ornithine cyclodeaminase family protein [Actinomycetes]ATY11393.1 ornithine cyclodeaminase [Amycolatopsis sp. AA4]